MEWVLIVCMALGLAVFVGEPLIRRSSSAAPQYSAPSEVEQLTLQKETLYMAIADLDFDFQTGKIDQTDYADLRQHFEGDALQLLRRLDEIDPLAGLDAELERQILAWRQLRSPEAASPTPHMCSQCGVALHGNENFCPTCGQPLLPA